MSDYGYSLKRQRELSPPSDLICERHYARPVHHLPRRQLARPLVPEKPVLRPSLLHHRGGDSGIYSSSDTETDGTSESELGTALSDVESEVRGAVDRAESSPVDSDGEEIDVVLMASNVPSSPITTQWPVEKGKGVDPREYGERSKKRRRIASPDGSDADEGDDEMEADVLLDGVGKRTTVGSGRKRCPALLSLKHNALAPTKSILQITRRMDDLAAGAVYEIEVERDDSDEDSNLVSAALPIGADLPQSPPITHFLPRGLLFPRRRVQQRAAVRRNGRKHARTPFRAMELTAADPFLLWTPDKKTPAEEELMITSDVEAKARVVCRSVQRLARHHAYPERLPGQTSTANLHRYSPTSLLPKREKHRRNPHSHSSHDVVMFARGPAHLGQAWLGMLHSQKAQQTHRRDVMSQHNKRTEKGSWRDGVGKWHMHSWAVDSVKPWWLHLPHREEEVEVEGLLPSAHVDGEVDAEAVDAFLREIPVVVSPRKRSTEDDRDEVSDRWARRNELRWEELRPYVVYLRASRRVREAEQARREGTEAAHERIEVEMQRRQDEERATAELEPIQEDPPASPSRESSGSPAPSEPPEYEFPFYPVVIPRPAHLIPRPAPRATVGPSSPPTYMRNLRYRSMSPPPPPPYNAATDRHTLVAPVFIEDDPEEEAMLANIRPSGLFRSPSLEQSIVGAFPEEPGQAAIWGAGRSAWDAALDLEEGEEDMVEGDFEEDVTQEVPVLGPIGRLLNRVWRW